MGNPVISFEIMTQDAPALRPFYAELFGLTFAEPAPGAGNVEYATVKPSERTGIEGGIGTAPEPLAAATGAIRRRDVLKGLDA